MISRNLVAVFFISISLWLLNAFVFELQKDLERNLQTLKSNQASIAGQTNLPTTKTLETENKISTTTTATTSPKTKSTTTPVKPTIKKTAKAMVETQATTTQIVIQNTEPLVDFAKLNDSTRKAVVNILCTTKTNELSPISGTGVMIDPRGIILTNAHIGQYFLLQDFRQKDFVQCVVRTGSPAYPQYNVELMYISPRWVEANKTILKDSTPRGTGENDFAFLHITKTINGSPLPDQFDFVPINEKENLNIGNPVLLVSYPAGFLGGLSILQDLNVASSITAIQKIYTYKESTVDLISVGGTVISQKGASGGAVMDGHGNLAGIISTSSDAPTTGERDLRAITIGHINRSLVEETTGDIKNLLGQDPGEVAKTFRDKIQDTLSKVLIDSLTAN